MKPERVAFIGINGRGWYARTYWGGVRRLIRVKVFYDLEEF